MSVERKRRVLVVEDDQDLRLGLKIRLGQSYATSFAEDGVSAMQVTRSFRPDAIVLDLGLPGGDGFKVLEWLRVAPEFAFIPVIVLTGQVGEGLEERAREAGAVGFLQKPADDSELVAMIDRLIEASGCVRQRALVVEDCPDARDGLRRLLTAHDFEVAVAEDGATALMAAVKHQPDVILLDLGLPGGGGIRALERMKALDELAGVPVVVLTGQDPDDYLEEALAAGAAAFLQKPAVSLELLTAIGAVT